MVEGFWIQAKDASLLAQLYAHSCTNACTLGLEPAALHTERPQTQRTKTSLNHQDCGFEPSRAPKISQQWDVPFSRSGYRCSHGENEFIHCVSKPVFLVT